MKNYNKKETKKFGTYYFLNDNLHRTDGPAIEYDNGEKRWYINGNLHRIYGPAVEYFDSSKEWWINNELIGLSDKGFTKEKFEQYKKLICLR